VLACDEAYAMPLATTLRSIAEHNRRHWPLDVTVLIDHLCDSTRRRITASLPLGAVTLRWVPVDLSRFNGKGLLPHVSRMTWARLQIPAVFASTTKRVLYLDCDLLVVDDLEALCRTELHGASLGAVIDFHVAVDRINRPQVLPAELPPVQNYFNAGVLLVDLVAWRKRRVASRAIEYLCSHPHTPYADQDALNMACDGDWAALNPVWNFQPHHTVRIERVSAPGRPAIVHFVHSSKPWKPSSASLNAGLYDDYRRLTCYRLGPAERIRHALATLGWRLWHRIERLVAACSAQASRAHHDQLMQERQP
jgi:lipopolysaccharide biosynthesis glycosyltransferase